MTISWTSMQRQWLQGLSFKLLPQTHSFMETPISGTLFIMPEGISFCPACHWTLGETRICEGNGRELINFGIGWVCKFMCYWYTEAKQVWWSDNQQCRLSLTYVCCRHHWHLPPLLLTLPLCSWFILNVGLYTISMLTPILISCQLKPLLNPQHLLEHLWTHICGRRTPDVLWQDHKPHTWKTGNETGPQWGQVVLYSWVTETTTTQWCNIDLHDL